MSTTPFTAETYAKLTELPKMNMTSQGWPGEAWVKASEETGLSYEIIGVAYDGDLSESEWVALTPETVQEVVDILGAKHMLAQAFEQGNRSTSDRQMSLEMAFTRGVAESDMLAITGYALLTLRQEIAAGIVSEAMTEQAYSDSYGS